LFKLTRVSKSDAPMLTQSKALELLMRSEHEFAPEQKFCTAAVKFDSGVCRFSTTALNCSAQSAAAVEALRAAWHAAVMLQLPTLCRAGVRNSRERALIKARSLACSAFASSKVRRMCARAASTASRSRWASCRVEPGGAAETAARLIKAEKRRR
jgi:hypothetical protein